MRQSFNAPIVQFAMPPIRPNLRPGSTLPPYVRSLLWDYKADQISLETDRDFLVGRVLSHGSWEAVTWLRRQVGDDVLRAWIVGRRGRELSPKQIRFWELVLDLEPEDVAGWLRARQDSVWDRRASRSLQPLVLKYVVEDVGHLLYSLVYFDEADTQPTPELIWDMEWEQVKDAIRSWTADLAG